MGEKALDCLLIHTPKFENWYKPLGDFLWINYMPIGIFALADYLVQHGYSSKIVHLGIEWIEDHDFNIVDFLEENKPDVAALSLHWHYQAYDVMKLAEAIKNKYPDVFTVVGGSRRAITTGKSWKSSPSLTLSYGEKQKYLF